MSKPYIGRFAPSPSGLLHFGSLIAALGSYLRARSQNGQWLIRVEDIDPPREVDGAASNILKTLEAYGLTWDGEVLYQSSRVDAYQAQIEQLLLKNQAYYCKCTRKMVREMGGSYDRRCFHLSEKLNEGAIRILNDSPVYQFEDKLKGSVNVPHIFAEEDFIIKRSDGLFAYQLAVVLDDHFQGITEVVRGNDLLEATCRQISLFNILGKDEPDWLHLPLASEKAGFKLSKQNHALPIDIKNPQKAFQAALLFLGQPEVELNSDIAKMVAQAVLQFELESVPSAHEVLI
ncbi:tRNA glutamyl-Q(34) synthetase GluQRS [Shewanella sp. OPT22]|nr:tRNA glutamyl-Q(34) synthetase GluQRS [Shewanella sp. OPT22]